MYSIEQQVKQIENQVNANVQSVVKELERLNRLRLKTRSHWIDGTWVVDPQEIHPEEYRSVVKQLNKLSKNLTKQAEFVDNMVKGVAIEFL